MSLASLADAALYGHPNPAAAGASSLTAYSDAELKAYAPPPDDLRKLCAAVGIDLDAALKEAGLAG